MQIRKGIIIAISILVIWGIIIGMSFGARELLINSVESSNEFVDNTTESGIGDSLYQQRFNATGDVLTHIVVIELPGGSGFNDITSSKWSNYTLYLTLFINNTMYKNGYTQIVSEPILRIAGAEDYADALVSETKLVTIINIINPNFEGEISGLQNDVHTMRSLIKNIDALFKFVEDKYSSFILNFLPSKEDIQKISLYLTGSAANFVDIIEVSEKTFNDSEFFAVIIIIIILTLVFRSPLGIAIPLISMVGTLFPAYLITYLLSKSGWYDVSDFLPSIIAMIGIAVAVDYNLFGLVRYREEFRRRRAEFELKGEWTKENIRKTQLESAIIMNKTAGKAVMYSGFTVIIGFTSLLIVGEDLTLGMAVGISAVVLLSILSARTLTPAILALFGNVLDWPNFMSGASKDVQKQKDNSSKPNFWTKWSKLVMRKPWTFLIFGILILTPFIVISAQTEVSFDLVKNLPPGTESRTGFEIIEENFNIGDLYPYKIIIDAGNESNTIFNSKIINASNELARRIMEYKDEREDGTILQFQSVESLSIKTNSSNRKVDTMSLEKINSIYNSPDAFVNLLPNNSFVVIPNYEKFMYIEYSKQYINWDIANNTMVMTVTSNIDAGSAASWELVKILRDMIHEVMDNVNEIKGVYVTGISAAFKDSSDQLYSDVPKMITVAVIFIFITLMILFRSLILPAKAILTISGSILFGMGALVFIFQHGNILNITIFGTTVWEAEQSGISYFIPVFLFTTILGLGMDYSIFIISRIKEEYERGNDMGNAVGLGLSKTAGVVTSAATIMVATFMIFALSPMLILKTMGLAMAISIVADATIARIILLPSAMKLAGKWNFYLPKWLKKILPEIKMEH